MPETILVSDFSSAEFASTISLRVRARLLGVDEARATFEDFDAWCGRGIGQVETTAADISAATAFLRRLDTGLRTPDAINIALAIRSDAELATFDRKMAAAARTLGARVARV